MGDLLLNHTKFYQDLAYAGFFVTETVPLIVPTQNGEIWFAIRLGLSILIPPNSRVLLSATCKDYLQVQLSGISG